MSPAPRVAVFGTPNRFLFDAIQEGGGQAVGLDDSPEVSVLDHQNDAAALGPLLDLNPSIRWVQLPTAGIEAYKEALSAHPDVLWTSAKGAYAEPVAEHALALTLAIMRGLKERGAARTWGPSFGTSLFGLNAVVVGAGGVGLEVVRLLKSLRMNVDVVRRTNAPAEGARRTVGAAELDSLLPDAHVVVVAAALTPGTRAMFGAQQFALMKPGAAFVNIARGGLVDTDALVQALRDGQILGAGLDVTDPEPLPDGHPLWDEPRALITPHVADTLEMIQPLLAARIVTNLRRFGDGGGSGLEGTVDPEAGY